MLCWNPTLNWLRFPGFSGEGSLQPITWDEWFQKFDERNLALLYQEETAGGEKSNFNKIVSSETAEENEERRRGGRPGRGGRSSATRPDSSTRSRARASIFTRPKTRATIR